MDTPEVTVLLTKAAAKVEELSKKMKTLEEEAERDKKYRGDLSERLQDMEQRAAMAKNRGELSGGGQAQGGFQIDLDVLQQNPALKAMQRGDKHARVSLQIEGLSAKALLSDIDGPDTVNGTFPVAAQRLPGFFGYAFRQIRLLQVLPSRAVGTNAYDFVRLSFTGDAAAQAEGERKAELEASGDTETAKVQTIAVITTASKQVLDDVAQLQAELGRILVEKVRAKAEVALVSGSGTGANYIEGLNTQATVIDTLSNEIPDRIGEAQVTMQNAGYIPNLIVMNPTDWFRVQTMKDSEGRYLYGDPASPAPPSLWGLPVVTTPSLAAGRALLVDTTKVLVLDREQVNVAISFENEDNFVRNLVTIRAEMRLGLAVFDTAAVRRIDLSPAT